jgi:hypothetical protein
MLTTLIIGAASSAFWTCVFWWRSRSGRGAGS